MIPHIAARSDARGCQMSSGAVLPTPGTFTMLIVQLRSGICDPKRRIVCIVSCALRSSEDEEVDYHECVDEHEWYWQCVSLIPYR